MALILMEFSSPVQFIQLLNQFLNTKYIGSVLCCVLVIQGLERERSLPITEERNTIITVTKMNINLTHGIVELENYEFWAQTEEHSAIQKRAGKKTFREEEFKPAPFPLPF